MSDELHDMNSICPEDKKAYEDCFNEWYSKNFLKGDISPACREQWEVYRACVQKVMKARKLEHLMDSKH
eukprot:JP439668.1.p1 GENE.JP439668.1~~JP439668.1.p1  ORF type:complete len:69 (-),score=18.06 JP439668.1:75-281(-)